MNLKETSSNQPQSSGFVDRDPIHNVWDQETRFRNAKSGLKSDDTFERTQEIISTGKALLENSDPYQVKIGIHLLRLCLWDNPALAEEWVESLASKLLSHTHPRVRHSALWNIRSSMWQDERLTVQGLKFAQVGLFDEDPAVQRVAIWTHGDAVVNNPRLYLDGLSSINAFLENNPKESNYLFALEEFFMPIKPMFHQEVSYREIIGGMKNVNDGFPGVKGRCASILEEDFRVEAEDREKIHQRLIGMTQALPEKDLVASGNYNEALHSLTSQFTNSHTFLDRMRRLWVIRDLSWMEDHVDKELFEKLAASLQDTRDGDLIRTTSVVLADNILKAPEEISTEAVAAAENFYANSDIDGSQIVVAQMLTPLKYFSPKTRSTLATTLSKLRPNAANRSVVFALNNLAA